MDLKTEAVLPNSTDNNRNKTEFSKKSTGHYKNALRRRRSVLLNDTLDTNSTKTLRSNDSQAEAIIISQVTGSLPGNNDDIVTTEIPVPHDQREETSPQTFIKREHYDPSYYQDYKRYFDIDKNDKVSQQDQRENLENEDSNVYNHEDFIPDEEKTTDNKNVEREETDSEQLEHSEPENSNNEELSGNSNLEFQGDSDGDAHVQDKSADESHDLNKNYNKQCVGDSGAHATDDDNGHSERLIRRNCEDNSKSLDWVNDNNAENDYNNNEAPTTKHDDEELNDSDDVYNPENAKEQFEFIPLDYSHDVKSAQNETADVEKPKFPFNIELGDTTVELDNITLPESVFGFYKSEFTDRMREKDKNDEENDNENVEENDNAEENDNDEDSNDDKKGEHDKASDDNEETSTDKPNNEEQSDDEDRPFYFTDNNDEDFIPGYVEFDSKLAKNSEALTDDENKEFVDHYIQDPQLKSAVGEILQRSKKTENEAGGEKDPKYNYFWTLEYGQPV